MTKIWLDKGDLDCLNEGEEVSIGELDIEVRNTLRETDRGIDKVYEVLSLFDGISCGQIALERAGIRYGRYYASEVKDIAINVTMGNYPNTFQLGDVHKVQPSKLGHIDLIIGGSPCQDLSVAMKNRKGLKGKKSTLFFEYLRVLKEVRKSNPNVYFLLENVATMSEENKNVITKELGVEPIFINSKLVSAQLRRRYYWTNIPSVSVPEDKGILLKDIITSGFVDKDKSRAINESESRPVINKEKLVRRYRTTGMVTLVFENSNYSTDSARVFNQIELERLQTLPVGYTKCLDRNKAAGVIGDGWTVDVIAHIFSGLKKVI